MAVKTKKKIRSASELFSGNSAYLKAKDFPRPRTLTITSVDLEEVGKGKEREEKPVVRFKEMDKGWAVGLHCWEDLQELLGDDLDSWIGEKVTLKKKKVQFGNDRVDGIRLVMPEGNSDSEEDEEDEEEEDESVD